MDLKYIGPSHFRVLEAADLKRHGVSGFTKTEWARGAVESVPDEAGQWLVDNLPDEFEKVEPQPKANRQASAPAQSTDKPS